MKLITGWTESISEPRAEQIETILRKMPGGGNSFIILENDTRHFIQVHGAAESGFQLEYWENGQGYYCDPDPTLKMVIQAFQSYAREDELWRTEITWEKLEEEPGAKNGFEARKTHSRYTKKGLLRLAAFAVFIPLFFCMIGGPAGFVFLAPAIVPGIFLAIDLDRRRKNFALPATPFTILVNGVVQSGFISLLIFWIVHPPKDWYLVASAVSTIGVMGTLSFLWGQRLVFLIQLNREGVEANPDDIWSEVHDVGGEIIYRPVYRYAGGQIGRSDPFWNVSEESNLVIRYLPQNPRVHRLIRIREKSGVRL